MTTELLRSRRALFALVRKDLTDVRLLLAFLLALDVAVIVAAHLVLDDELLTVVLSTRMSVAAIGVLSMVPVVAEVYSVDERAGTCRVVQALPISRGLRAVSKVVSLTCVVGLAMVVVLLTQEMLKLAGLTQGMEHIWSEYRLGERQSAVARRAVVTLGALVAFVAITALIVRSSLVALLGSLSMVGLLGVMLTYGIGSRVENEWLHFVADGALDLLVHPAAALAVVVFLVIVTPLRGLATRSMWRRAFAVLSPPLVLAGAAFAGVTLREIHRSPPSLDDPTARIVGIKPSPNGRQVLLALQHSDSLLPRNSIWVADTSSWRFTRMPVLRRSKPSTLPTTARLSNPRWAIDGHSVLARQHSAGGGSGDDFMIAPSTGRATPITYEEAWRLGSPGEFRRDIVHFRRGRGSVVLLNGQTLDIGDHFPIVPSRADHTVFFLGEARVLHRVDRATGEETVLSIIVPEGTSPQVSPDGRYLSVKVRGQNACTVVELKTGRTREVGSRWVLWTRRDAPFAFSERGGKEWTLCTMEGDEALTFDRDIRGLSDVDGRYWLGTTQGRRSAHVFDADGGLVRTIFEERGKL